MFRFDLGLEVVPNKKKNIFSIFLKVNLEVFYEYLLPLALIYTLIYFSWKVFFFPLN